MATTDLQMQTSLAKEVSFAGQGLFTAEKVKLTLCPASANTGIVFCRTDLPSYPLIPAKLSAIQPAPRCTQLGVKEARVLMVEHLLSALYALGVDNALVQVQGSEIVAGDGSSNLFVDLIEQAGIVTLDSPRRSIKIQEPIFWSDKEVHLIALPAEEFRLSYTMHYPHSTLLKSQYFSLSLDPTSYKQEIAQCRTFSLYEEILPFIERGLIKGGGLDNALVIRGEEILNPGGARFDNEPVRHKILDLVGDLALIGVPLIGHIIAIRSGHASNVAFAQKIALAYGLNENNIL